MKTILIIGTAITLATVVGIQLGNTPVERVSNSLPVQRISNPRERPQSAAPVAQVSNLSPVQRVSNPLDVFTPTATFEQLDQVAQNLAEQNTPESIQTLLTGIEKIKDWPTRAALAKNLRAVTNPETLQTLLPALLNNYGRGNTILNEISDTIARLAQPETVEDLAALHWQAAVQAGQGHKVLRTVACIRNPVATRGLMKVAARDDSPALVAAANEALKAMKGVN